MKILVTGNKGFVGTYFESLCRENSISVTGFDIKDGFDIGDYAALQKAARGCDALIHLAAVDTVKSTEIVRTNILGTINVLNVFRDTAIKKLVFLSSVDALGVFQGEAVPNYLPLDDEYPCHPQKPYAVSKYAGELMCRYYQALCGKPLLCIRAPGIWEETTYAMIVEHRRRRPSYEWDPYWEYGAFIDVRDLADALLLSLFTTFSGFHCHAIASDDITTSGKTSKELVDFLYPGILWKGDESYSRNPYKTLLNNDKMKTLLAWNPKYSWKDRTRFAG